MKYEVEIITHTCYVGYIETDEEMEQPDIIDMITYEYDFPPKGFEIVDENIDVKVGAV